MLSSFSQILEGAVPFAAGDFQKFNSIFFVEFKVLLITINKTKTQANHTCEKDY